MKSASGSFTKRANHAVLAWYQLHEFAVGPKDSVKRYLKTRSVQWNSRKTALDSFSKVRLHHHPYGFYCPPFWEAHILDSPWGSTVSSSFWCFSNSWHIPNLRHGSSKWVCLKTGYSDGLSPFFLWNGTQSWGYRAYRIFPTHPNGIRRDLQLPNQSERRINTHFWSMFQRIGLRDNLNRKP